MPIDTGNTAWMLMSTALVMLMLPGLALFYGGLVRAKNVLSTIMHSFFGLAIVTVVWVIVGFSLAFAPSVGGLGIVGGLDYAFFQGVGMEPVEGFGGANGIPFVLFATFQMMFAAITPALISGAFAERKRFGAFVALHHRLVAARLLADGPHGLGRRHPLRPRRPRLRGRHRRPHRLRRLGARRGPRHGQARGRPSCRAARRAHDRPRRRPPVVRLVRLQRRLGAGAPTGWRRRRSWSRPWPRPPARSPGSAPPTPRAARSASSARPRVPWPASWPSPRRPAS